MCVVQELNLTDNMLTTLPAELGKALALERLLLGLNRLQSLHPARACPTKHAQPPSTHGEPFSTLDPG
jgi:Leucine-rich repeat (LRR) protein